MKPQGHTQTTPPYIQNPQKCGEVFVTSQCISEPLKKLWRPNQRQPASQKTLLHTTAFFLPSRCTMIFYRPCLAYLQVVRQNFDGIRPSRHQSVPLQGPFRFELLQQALFLGNFNKTRQAPKNDERTIRINRGGG